MIEAAMALAHGALIGLRVTHPLVDLYPLLLTLLLTLPDIGFAPVVLAPAYVLGEVHHSATMDPELLERFVEHLFIYPELRYCERLLVWLGLELNTRNALAAQGLGAILPICAEAQLLCLNRI